MSDKNDEPKLVLVNRLCPMSKFIPFGRYLLSLKNLQKNKFLLQYPVLSFRTIQLTKRTKNIVQKLLQDIDVTFEEIGALNEDERNVINQIVEKT